MESVLKPFLELFREIYIGSEFEQTWIIDGTPGYGFTTTIKQITAKMASTPMVEGGSTIAGHTEHLRWSLEFAMTFYKGQQPSGSWEESWRIRKVNNKEWEELQLALLIAYQNLVNAIREVNDWSNPSLLKGTLALLPHAAYHLGAVKQLIIAVHEHK
ncbi:MAG: hypothetical protein P0Y49_12865 [Candidatus Pedobacter colombiensis]|uniref:Uncharacterized protein n=1 Tax=Candidatus Pedobacter colombiensis TaxID=3121371 RepID=A0AAJ6B748_9SPHI|nr:hypothetical protein [Pedobacter sp.]WEK17688.1 MAG: hypothetical protein P0Y49_12865 [Pedobacter sp.]